MLFQLCALLRIPQNLNTSEEFTSLFPSQKGKDEEHSWKWTWEGGNSSNEDRFFRSMGLQMSNKISIFQDSILQYWLKFLKKQHVIERCEYENCTISGNFNISKKSKDPKRYLWYGKQIIFEEYQKQESYLLWFQTP